MQTPRVEWFVSKGQRLPIGQSPPDVTGARLLLVRARRAEVLAYLPPRQSQQRAVRPGPRDSALGAAGEGGAPARPAADASSCRSHPHTRSLSSDTATLQQPGRGLLPRSPLTLWQASCDQKQCPLHLKQGPLL